MKNWYLYVSITIVAILIFILFAKFKKDFIKKTSKCLYEDNNPDLYINRINSLLGKLYLNKKVRLFRLIDGYALKNDTASIIKIFNQLDNIKLSFGQQVSLYEKEVNFYIENKMYDEAYLANEKMQECNRQVEIIDLNKIAVSCQALIDIYINKDGSLAEEMVKAADDATINTVKGTYYFRAAKCYYYKKDNKNVDKYLKKASVNLVRTSWAPFLESCLEDHSHIDER